MSAPPLHARLFRYRLSAGELGLLRAMVEHCSTGATIWASTRRLAAYSKLSVRQVQRIIDQLLKRRILRELAPANANGRRCPATFAINEAALEDDPAMAEFLAREKQQTLPGISRPSIPGEPLRPRSGTVATGDMMSPIPVTLCRVTGDMMSSNPLNNSLRDLNPTPKPPAATFQDAIERHFQQLGFDVEREVAIPNRGDDHEGRIDLLARRDREVVAIECDRERPREKSREKLLAFSEATQKLIILREPVDIFRESPTLENLIQAAPRPAPRPCDRCLGSGLRPSYDIPGRSVLCECREAN
jgi:hypothetical protein